MDLLSWLRHAGRLPIARHGFAALLAMIVGLLISSPGVFSSQSTLTWDRCLDSEVIGYRVYYGNSSRDYFPAVEVGNQTTCKVDGLIEDLPYFFAVTSYDHYGYESDYSEEVSQTVYSNAEDLSIGGWDFCPGDPGGAEIHNVYDEELQRNAIELRGPSFQNCYWLLRKDLTEWGNTYEFVFAWSMKYTEVFRVTVMVVTTNGSLQLRYVPFNNECAVIESGVSCGVGTDAKDGRWHHFRRNLQADLDHALPGTKILKVKRLAVRGSGRLVDIKLLSTPL